MTTRRKPLPYSASYLVDQALMELADLTRSAMILVNQDRCTPEEQLRLLTKIVDHAYKATINLREISRQGDKDNGK